MAHAKNYTIVNLGNPGTCVAQRSMNCADCLGWSGGRQSVTKPLRRNAGRGATHNSGLPTEAGNAKKPVPTTFF